MSKKNAIRKWICVVNVLLLFAVTVSICPQTVYAMEFSKDSDGNLNAHDDDGYYYMVEAGQEDSGECVLYTYGGKETDLVLPKTCDSYKVVTVGKNFSVIIQQFGASLGNDKNSLTSVKIPYGYKTIESGDRGKTGAFQNQKSLTSVEIPESVTKIGENVFDGCNLKKLTIIAPYGSEAQKYASEHGIKYRNNVKLNKSSLTIQAGSASTLTLSNTKKKITWKSGNTAVATVDSRGKVSAKRPGTARITATVSGKTYECTVNVR